MSFSLQYVSNVALLHLLHSMSLVALHHVNEIRKRAGDVMSYTSLFVGREKSSRCGSPCNEKTRFALISVTTEGSRSHGGVAGCSDLRIYQKTKLLQGIALKSKKY